MSFMRARPIAQWQGACLAHAYLGLSPAPYLVPPSMDRNDHNAELGVNHGTVRYVPFAPQRKPPKRMTFMP